MIVSRESIRRQAEQDARDELDGHKVHNPYPPGSDAYTCWQQYYLDAIYWHHSQLETES